MAWTKLKTAVAVTAAILLGTCSIAIISATSGASTDDAAPANAAKSKEIATTPVKSSPQALVFRNERSWNRKPDFEEVLAELGFKFDVKSSDEMQGTDLAPLGISRAGRHARIALKGNRARIDHGVG